MRRQEADVWVLDALRHVELFLADEENPWSDLEERLAAVREARRRRFSITALRRALAEEETRWRALELARERRAVELVPDLRRLLQESPRSGVLRVLGEIGGAADLEALRQAIPELVDLDHRALETLADRQVFGFLRDSLDYAAIVRHLGRLGSAEAVASLKTALGDFDPAVRRAALEGLEELPAALLDAELRGLLRQRCSDPAERVSRRAVALAARLLVTGD